MSFRRMTAAAATGALLLSSPTFAQDSATVDVEATLVESPATFSISGLSPLSFGQISLPRYYADQLVSRCSYFISDVQGDGSATMTMRDPDGGLIPVGTVSAEGCYAIGDGQPAHFEFTCDSVDVSFSFSSTNAPPRPEWYPRFYEPATGFSNLAIGKDGISVTSGSDVNIGDPWGVNCITEGAGTYDLYVGGRVELDATADTSTATLGAVTLGTLTVDAIY